MQKVSEKSIQIKILKYLNSLDGCFARKRMAYPGLKGEPDITGCLKGLRLEIEVKGPDGILSPKQESCIRRWRDCGALAIAVDNLEDVISAIRFAIKEH